MHFSTTEFSDAGALRCRQGGTTGSAACTSPDGGDDSCCSRPRRMLGHASHGRQRAGPSTHKLPDAAAPPGRHALSSNRRAPSGLPNWTRCATSSLPGHVDVTFGARLEAVNVTMTSDAPSVIVGGRTSPVDPPLQLYRVTSAVNDSDVAVSASSGETRHIAGSGKLSPAFVATGAPFALVRSPVPRCQRGWLRAPSRRPRSRRRASAALNAAGSDRCQSGHQGGARRRSPHSGRIDHPAPAPHHAVR